MKIGILTQPLRNNYGGLLQNYALQTIIKRGGHEAVTIDWSWPRHKDIRLYIRTIIRHILYYISLRKIAKPQAVYEPTNEEDGIIHQNVYEFTRKYIVSTSKSYDSFGLRNAALKQNCDAYVVGSDQCWRPCYNAGVLTTMYLDFVKDESVMRLSYASSFGTDKWEYTEQETKLCAEYARKFNLITVREESGIGLCKEYLGVAAKHVLDPTMLLDKEDYVKLIDSENEQKSNGNLFFYILDPSENKTRIIEAISESQGYVPFTVLPKYKEEYRTKEQVKEDIKGCVYPSVTTWLRAFMDAEMTIVDSFHGMVFSIIFNKPFWVIGNKERGMSRFISLLGQFELQNRLLDVDNFDYIDINKPIDWVNVNKKRQALKEQSLSLLYNTLNNEQS